MALLASVIMGLDGVVYMCLGACMLAPPRLAMLREVATLYPALFKPLREVSADPEAETVIRPVSDLVHDLGYRMMAYMLVLVGVARLLTSFNWGCGYVFLGMWTCLAEMGMICNELLRQESMYMHGAVAAIMGNVFLGMSYIILAAPQCA